MSKIIKNASFYTIGNILPQTIGFFLLPFYTRYLTPADYGIISSLQVLTSILTIFFTLAIDRSIYRMYFDHKTEDEKRDYLGTITIALLLVSSCVLALIFIFRGTVAQLYNSILFYPYYAYAIFAAFFSILQVVPKIYFQVNEKAEKFVMISLAQFLLNAGFTLWFVVGRLEGAAGVLKGELVANIIIAPLIFYISYKTINFKFKSNIFLESLKFSLPLIPGLLSAFVLNLSDRIFIERYFTLAEVGLYSLSYKISGLIGVVSGSLLLAYSQVFFRNANSENQVAAKQKIESYNHTFIIVIIITATAITLFSKEAIILLLDHKYKESYKIIPILAVGHIIIQVTSLFNMMIYQSKKSVGLMAIGIFSAALSILLNFLLIPRYGSFGAAFTTVIAFFCVSLLSWAYARKCYYIPFKWNSILVLFLPIVVIIVFFQYLMVVPLYVSLILKTVLCAIGVFIFFRFYRLEIKNIFN